MAEYYCADEILTPRRPSHSGPRPRPIFWALPVVILTVALVLLAASLPPTLVYLPDALLTLVRLSVSFCAALIAYATWRNNAVWGLAFAALGLFYNPVLTIHLRDDAWVIAHSAALLLFVLHWTFLGARLSRAP